MMTHGTFIEYLTSFRLGRKGQLTLPKQLREDLGLGSGTCFAVLRFGDGLVLLPEQQWFEHFQRKVSRALAGVMEYS